MESPDSGITTDDIYAIIDINPNVTSAENKDYFIINSLIV